MSIRPYEPPPNQLPPPQQVDQWAKEVLEGISDRVDKVVGWIVGRDANGRPTVTLTYSELPEDAGQAVS